MRVGARALSVCVLVQGCVVWAQTQDTTTQYEYDAVGSRTKVTDPRGRVSTHSYDAHGRALSTVQPPAIVGGPAPTITNGWDGQDRLKSVVDPRMLTTTYSTTGIGNTVQWVSPDAGTSSATFDAAGNMITRTDARGKTVSYSHDALGRVTLINYPTGTDTTLEYDGGSAGAPNAVGRLTKMVDESGNTTFGYDARGRVTSKTQTVGTGSSAKVRTVTYAYGTTGSATGKLVSITYPSGNRVNYGYDAAGRVSWMTLNPTNSNGTGTNTGTTVALVADIAYEPTGAVKSWSWGASASGNGVTRTYDLDGRLTSYPLGHPSEAGLVRTVHYDAASRITGYTHVNGSGQAQPAYDQTFSYDDLNRLTGWTQGSSSTSYAYDVTGNRTQVTIAANAYGYTVATNSNRLSATAGPAPGQTNTYDASGNLTGNGTYTLTYSDRGRLKSVSLGAGTVSYVYNALEQRVRKSGPTSLVATGANLYVYDEAGRLLGDYTNALRVVRETVTLGELPIVVLGQTVTGSPASFTTQVYRVYADQIGTPRVITQATNNKMRWRWDSAEPFGTTPAQENPAAVGVFGYDPRFAGQMRDKETGLHYNWHRDYDAGVGRYVQSDPIGLAGGINTYAYALGNPLSLVDPDGLDATVCLYPASGPWGHVGIGINSSSTSGLYPRDGAGGNPVTGTPGIVKPDSGKAEQCKAIQTTAEQDKKMADFLARATANPGTYKFTGNNCTNLVRLTLQQGGISTSGQPGPRPYFESLPGRP